MGELGDRPEQVWIARLVLFMNRCEETVAITETKIILPLDFIDDGGMMNTRTIVLRLKTQLSAYSNIVRHLYKWIGETTVVVLIVIKGELGL